MDITEYKEKRAAIKKVADKKLTALNALNIEYATKNNPVKRGDIVSDETTTIVVDRLITEVQRSLF